MQIKKKKGTLVLKELMHYALKPSFGVVRPTFNLTQINFLT